MGSRPRSLSEELRKDLRAPIDSRHTAVQRQVIILSASPLFMLV